MGFHHVISVGLAHRKCSAFSRGCYSSLAVRRWMIVCFAALGLLACQDNSTGCCVVCNGSCACGNSCLACSVRCTEPKGCACSSGPDLTAAAESAPPDGGEVLESVAPPLLRKY
jgi:hypothetical protein